MLTEIEEEGEEEEREADLLEAEGSGLADGLEDGDDEEAFCVLLGTLKPSEAIKLIKSCLRAPVAAGAGENEEEEEEEGGTTEGETDDLDDLELMMDDNK